MRVAFLHPDLGLGGAERLVVDAALSLQEKFGHEVEIYTSFHDPKRAFKETCDGTLKIRVFGSFFPRQILGSLHVLFAILSNFYAALWLLVACRKRKYNAIFMDQIPIAIPLFKLLLPKETKVFFFLYTNISFNAVSF